MPLRGEDPGVCGVWQLILHFWFEDYHSQIIWRITQTRIDHYLQPAFKPTAPPPLRPFGRQKHPPATPLYSCLGARLVSWGLQQGTSSGPPEGASPPWPVSVLHPRVTQHVLLIAFPDGGASVDGAGSQWHPRRRQPLKEGLAPRRWMSCRDEANNGQGEGWNFDRAAERHGFSDHR